MTSDTSSNAENATTMGVGTPQDCAAAPATLFVCITCRMSLEPGVSATMTTDGRELFDLVGLLHNTHPAADQVMVRSVECLGSCDQGCTAGIGAPGKYAYLLGGLEPTREHAAAILDCALLLGQQSGSVLGRLQRPPLLRNRLLGRMPPLPLSNPRNTAP